LLSLYAALRDLSPRLPVAAIPSATYLLGRRGAARQRSTPSRVRSARTLQSLWIPTLTGLSVSGAGRAPVLRPRGAGRSACGMPSATSTRARPAPAADSWALGSGSPRWRGRASCPSSHAGRCRGSGASASPSSRREPPGWRISAGSWHERSRRCGPVTKARELRGSSRARKPGVTKAAAHRRRAFRHLLLPLLLLVDQFEEVYSLCLRRAGADGLHRQPAGAATTRPTRLVVLTRAATSSVRRGATRRLNRVVAGALCCAGG